MKDGIRIFDFKMDADDRQVLHQLVDQVIDEGYLTNHTLVRNAEEKFREFQNLKYVSLVNNGTSALVGAINALPRDKRKKIIVPNNTFIACWHAVIQNQYEPIIVDSDDTYLGFNLSKLEEAIKENDVFAIICVHLGGIIAPNIFELQKIAKKHNVFLIEDCAHAHSSSKDGIYAGNFGDIAAFSFHLTKTITSGEGGAIATSSKELQERIHSIRQFGMTKENSHLFIMDGFNFKMSELDAAFLITDLNRAKKRIERRSQIAQKYFKNIKNFNFLFPDKDSTSGFYKCFGVLKNKKRDILISEFKNKYNINFPNGIYYTPLSRQPIVKNHSSFQVSDFFSDNHLCLPCYPELTDLQINYFVEKFNEHLDD